MLDFLFFRLSDFNGLFRTIGHQRTFGFLQVAPLNIYTHACMAALEKRKFFLGRLITSEAELLLYRETTNSVLISQTL